MSEVIVRQAEAGDLASAQTLAAGLYESDARFNPHLNPAYPYTDMWAELYLADLPDPRQTFYMAVDENTEVPVGYLRGSYHPITGPNLAMLDNLFVSRSYRSQGIATKLIEKFFAWAHNQGGEMWGVTVFAQNEPARRLYIAMGARPLLTSTHANRPLQYLNGALVASKIVSKA